MDKEKFKEYLSNRYEDQIKWYDEKSTSNQSKYRFFQWGVIILSSLTPVLILFSGENKLIPIVVAIFVAIFTAVLKTFKYQENWVEYRTTCETLRKEKHFYDANLYEYDSAENKESLFVERVENLISRENTRWIEISTLKEKEVTT